jgi:hypothetical protein
MRNDSSSKLLLARVADIYNDENNPHPTRTIAERFGISTRTATRWANQAREAGLITRTPPLGGPISERRNIHGTTTCYDAGCRCDACRTANTEYHSRYRRQRFNSAADRTDEIPHGTKGGYRNWGCKCDECVAAGSAENLKQRRNRLRRKESTPHGTLSGYQSWGCRCVPCINASREYRRTRVESAGREYKPRKSRFES